MRLKSITIENFRSIRGNITVGLDAPIVLIHGPNGAGKTSLLSAIEIGLLGQSTALSRVDPEYVRNLRHQRNNETGQSPSGRIQLSVDIDGIPKESDLKIAESAITGQHILNVDQSRFYSERCYLAQSVMGRLLDLYQHKEKKADSALTKFVKDLLGLDQFDALIDGLHPAGNVTRLREPVPIFWGAREDIPKLENEQKALTTQIQECADDIAQMETALRGDLSGIGLDGTADLIELNEIRRLFAGFDLEPQLQSIANVRRSLIAMREQWHRAMQSGGAPDLAPYETEYGRTLEIFERWQQQTGDQLKTVLLELKQYFPDIQTLENTSPETVRNGALHSVNNELTRMNGVIDRDSADAGTIASLDETLVKGTSRLNALDQQIEAIASDTSSLANALAVIQPHIHSDDCPVCNRNFQELRAGPLAAHISGNIAKLIDASGRLQALVADRVATTAAITQTQRDREIVVSRRPDESALNDLRIKRARFREIQQRLEKLSVSCKQGDDAFSNFESARSKLNALRSANDTIVSLRTGLYNATVSLSITPMGEDENIELALDRIMNALQIQETGLESRRGAMVRAKTNADQLTEARERQKKFMHTAEDLRQRLERLKSRKTEADRRIELAKSLASRTISARSSLVRRVFNEDLNSVWKDLFVRLAPDEPFIPAFAIPNSSGPVEALLKTVHRNGGDGGNPKAMLSAGNLNTAALTLFLSLHLSVNPTLPCLVIDDPVQSMDEVHIAQFAALLRTLSKQHHRQIIIAVHEKALFDYLALELSPAFLDDRLITVEIGRSSIDETTAPWRPHTYFVDKAIAA